MRLRGIINRTGRKSLWLGILFLFIAGNIMPAFAATETINYTYDDLYRLTQVASDAGYVEDYAYDEVGNRTEKIVETAIIITATAGSGGSIFPAGNVPVWPGTDQSFDITANGPNHLEDILVDGTSVGPLSSYTFTNVTSPHTIEARFFDCGVTIDPASQAFAQSGGTGSVSISMLNACAWTTESYIPWITIMSEGSGTGNGAITYSVSEGTNIVPRAGTITVAGQTFTVTQAAAIFGAGGLDATFNAPKGAVTFDSGSNGSDGYAMAIQPDGKIVVVGTSYSDTTSAVILRYNNDGTLDSSFGTNGFVKYTVIGWNEGNAVAIQPDGKIVVAGTTYNFIGGFGGDVVVSRFNADGAVDNSFGTNGLVTYNAHWWDEGNAVAIQPDGRIVVAGGSYNGLDSVLVLRYNADGTPDNNFGTNGIVTYTDDVWTHGYAVATQPDGKIAVVGTGNYSDTTSVVLLRYNNDGTLDSSFGTNGLVTYNANGWTQGNAVTIQPDGKIVVAGTTYITNGAVEVLRFNADGALDNTFGAGGVVNYSDGSTCYGNAVALQPDGKIVVVGQSNDESALLVLRYGADGVPDNFFGAHGVITYNSGVGAAVAIQPDGKIAVAGSSYEGPNPAILVLRINGDTTGQHSLSVNKLGAGIGSVMSSETPTPFIDCGTTCNRSYNQGDSVILTALTEEGSTFTEWSGDCSGTASPVDVIMLDRDMDCTATFILNQHNLTVNTAGNGTGTVGGEGVYDYGTTQQATATADPGSTFSGWSGDCSGTASPVDVTMVDLDMTCTATFTVNTYTITTTAGPNGSVSCSPNPVKYDSSSTCTISPNTGYGIYTVTVDDIEQNPTPSSYTFNNVQAAHSIAATFADTIAPVLTVSTLSGNSWTSNGTLNISGDVFDDGSGLQGLTINGVAVVVNPDSTFSHAVLLAEGANTITVIATDNDSNTTTDTRTINYDPFAPVITIDQPVDNSKTNNQSVTVSGYADDYSAVSGITNNLLPLPFSFNEADGAFSANAGLTYGTNTIEVGASDLALNTATAKRTVTYDNLAPSLSVTQPPQDITTSQSSLDVQGTVSDLTIPTVTMTVDGGAPETLAVTAGQFSKTVTFTSKKIYVIQVTAVDEAGNSSTVTRNIIYHYAPEANFNTNVNYSASYTLDFDASATTCPSGYACAYSWDFDDDGNEDAAGITATHSFAGSGPYPVTLTVTTNALTVDSITKNVTPVEINVVKLPPTAAHTSLVSPVVKGSPVSFVDASQDNNHEFIASVYVNWGDGNVVYGAAAATFFSHTYANSGKYTIIHTATDAGGRMASELIPVQVTLTAGTKTKITVNVTQSDAATPVSGARIYLKKAGVPVTTGYSNIAGTWTFSNLVAADDYTVEVYKSGVDFGNGKGKASAKIPADTSAPMDVTLDISSVNP